MSHDIKPADLMLSAQRALLGSVTANLRQASIEVRGTMIHFRCVFEFPPSDLEIDLIQCAGTEIIADFSEPYKITEECVDTRLPWKPKSLKHVVFERHEPK